MISQWRTRDVWGTRAEKIYRAPAVSGGAPAHRKGTREGTLSHLSPGLGGMMTKWCLIVFWSNSCQLKSMAELYFGPEPWIDLCISKKILKSILCVTCSLWNTNKFLYFLPFFSLQIVSIILSTGTNDMGFSTSCLDIIPLNRVMFCKL